jgi:hypothetical protein
MFFDAKARKRHSMGAPCDERRSEELPLGIGSHPSFDRPLATARLWRYTDVPKFIDLLISGQLWLTNAEVLAKDDPYDGLPGAVQFPHRMWRTIDDVPEQLRSQILEICGKGSDTTPESAFRSWFMGEEQRCIMGQSGRRDYYVNCWHAAEHESAAMWKIYGSPGAGVAIVSNGARLETALAAHEEEFYLGTVEYRDPSFIQIGIPNAFDTMMIKRSSFEYEREVRLVHWHTGEFHDALVNFAWDDERMRFDDLIEDARPLRPGMSFACDVDAMIERVIVSPFAPLWYAPMIERVRERLGYRFSVQMSKLLELPPVVP